MTLSDYLAEAGLKPSQFASKLGAPASTVTRILNQKRAPRLALMRRIAEATHGQVTPNDFLAESDQGERA